MNAITIKPKNKKELRAIKLFFKTFDIAFEEEQDDTKMSKEEFFAMIEARKKDIEDGKVIRLTEEMQKELFKSVL
jgi:hypothetical protein